MGGIRAGPVAAAAAVGATLIGAALVAALQPSGSPTGAPTSAAAAPSPSRRAEPPDASTTGVVAGTALRRVDGLEVVRDGAVLEGLEVRGALVIAADNVTVRNTRIVTDTERYPVHVREGVVGALLEYIEVDNQGSSGKGIYFDGGTGSVRYADVHSAEDGIAISADGVLVEHSYVHHLHRTSTSHNDAIQIRRGHGITIRYNNLQAYNDLTGDHLNAAIQIGSLVGDEPIAGLQVIGNWMNGGNVTVNGGGRGEVASAVYRDNRFGRDYRFGVAGNLENSVWDSSNVFDDNDEPARGSG